MANKPTSPNSPQKSPRGFSIWPAVLMLVVALITAAFFGYGMLKKETGGEKPVITVKGPGDKPSPPDLPAIGDGESDNRDITWSGPAPVIGGEPVNEEKNPTPPAEQQVQLDGRFAYSAPGVMVVSQPYFISLALTSLQPGDTREAVDARLAQDTRETLGETTAPVRAGDVKIGAEMTAKLEAQGAFDMQATSVETQKVDPKGITRWLWQVTPKAAGKGALTLRIYVTQPDGTDKEVRVIPAIVDVRAAEDVFRSNEQMATRSAATASSTTSTPAPTGCKAVGAGTGTAKLALVIANQNYTGVKPLEYALQDGGTIRDVLAEAGFSVTYCENLGTDALATAMGSFRDVVKKAAATGETAAAFYYAGHGASTPSAQQTYLLPVSLRQASVALIELQGVSVDAVVSGLSAAGAKRLLVVIDACRDVLKVDGDDETRGFHLINWRTSAYDITAYATLWGEKARDNGLYAKALAKWIRAMPGEDAAAVLNKVQTEVSDETDENQVPQYNDRMPGVFAIRGK